MKTTLPLLFFCLLAIVSKSQLIADFKTTNGINGGCSPFSVFFQDLTQSASSSATYKWDLGNGNTSTLQNPGATYVTEKTYTVVLTVTDNGKVSTKQLDIIVYKKPTVNFLITDTRGCIPFSTIFTSKSQAGDGTIANYFWDFGDGKSANTTDTFATHAFISTQSPKIGLVVVNSFGCQSSLNKDTSIIVNQPPIAKFTLVDSVICSLKDSLFFKNNSTGAGNITYKWNFGDSATATSINASHVYATKGLFDVRLIATSDLGISCADTFLKKSAVAIASSDFNVPAALCSNNLVKFQVSNTNSTTATTQWFFSDDNYQKVYNGSVITRQFVDSGKIGVRMINSFSNCKDTVAKQITVNKSPVLTNFLINYNVVCSVPVLVTVKDTSVDAVKWLWHLNGADKSIDSTKTVSTLYQKEGTYNISLLVTNSKGCTDTLTKTVVLKIPKFTIDTVASTSPTGLTGCPGFSVTFKALPSSNLASYTWDFGDSSATSSLANPSHTFTKEGANKVTLSYVTKDSCTGVITFDSSIIVYKKPVVDFTVSDTVICGSNPVMFTDKSSSPATAWDWYFGDGTHSAGTSQTIIHKYYDSGYYNIKLVTYNNTCSDSLVKKKYVYVLPLFANINNVLNTCNNQRDSVWFLPKYRFVDSVTWRFGDGSSVISSPTVDTLLHQYKATNRYTVGITISNKYCTLIDSTVAYVLLKQAPNFTANADTICLSDSLHVLVSNLENNPDTSKNYSLYQWQFGDGTNFNGGSTARPPSFTFGNSFSSLLWNLKNGTQTIRSIVKSERFGCYDTTNFITVTTKGPTAIFNTTNGQNCFKQPVVFNDVSKAGFNAPIATRNWLFGDATSLIKTDSSLFAHLYNIPASYVVQLKVIDTEGCYSIANNAITPIQIVGPKADFIWNPNLILTGTSATFTNTTNSFGSSNTIYQWHFSNNGFNTSVFGPINQAYANTATVDTVQLIATNNAIACADTVVKIIPIKRIGLAFTFTTAYINQANCPPLIATFNTQLQRVSAVSWNFGDGTTIGNITAPTHTYTKPGIYKVTLYGYVGNALIDSVYDNITIKGPYAKLSTNATISCLPFTVTLTANTINAASFIWDFGDGSLSAVQDTIATHQYLTPGIYQPVLIMKDISGCSAAFSLPTSIIVDSLKMNVTSSPMAICKAGVINFSNRIISISDSLNPASTAYHWVFGTGNIADTSNLSNINFNYTKVGKYPVSLRVNTASGCTKTMIDTIEVKPVAVTTIAAPASICEHDAATFTATSTITNNVTYQWAFGNGVTFTLLNPLPQSFTSAAASTTYNVVLISTLNGCSDTSNAIVKVLHNPVVNLIPKLTNICLGNSLVLTAHDGATYQWQANGTTTNNTFTVQPKIDSKYMVTVTSAEGCVTKDSTVITVSQPFNISVSQDVILCIGNTTNLRASGADNYRWINNTTGLSAINIANPLANPIVTTKYTVIGYDNAGCFSDTNSINVTLAPLPIINAGPDLSVGTGTSININATGSSDIVSWLWSPAKFLNCTSCPATTTTPRTDITYTITATTQYGCTAKDSMNIKLHCIEGNLFIPSAFTPNKDQRNDVFYPLGRGIKNVRYFAIFNRSGEKIFDRANFNINDKSFGWNGMFKGNEVASGVYVYMIEVACDTGDIFSNKGTVTVIR